MAELPDGAGPISSDTAGYTLATEFQLSASCKLDNIWFYSASGAGALPARCAIWDVSSQTVVAGTDNTSPSWSGAAGSGWVSCAYSGVTLPAGDYKVAVYYGGGSAWYQAALDYWTSGPGASGITAGPVTAPSASGGHRFRPGHLPFRLLGLPADLRHRHGENYWVDAEVTPA